MEVRACVCHTQTRHVQVAKEFYVQYPWYVLTGLDEVTMHH